jgi:small subunit ribosomal protein S3
LSPKRRQKLGRKVHPYGFRLGVIRDWQAKWYADKAYLRHLQEDLNLRKALRSKYTDAGISLVEIDRQGEDKILVNIFTSRPGVVIGRGGQRVDEMRQGLQALMGKSVQINIQEIRQPELDAYLVALSVAESIVRRVAYRRALKQAMGRTIEAGAKGIRITCSGRLAGAEIARREMMHTGQVPLQKLRADVDYGFAEAHTTLGRIGIKVWIYKGDILPELKEVEVASAVAEAPEVTEETAVAEVVSVPKAAMETVAVEEAKEVLAPAPATEAEKKPRRKKVETVATAEPAVVVEEAKEVLAPAPATEAEKKPRRKKVETVAAEPAPAPEAVAVEEAAEKPKRRKKKSDTETTAGLEEHDATT